MARTPKPDRPIRHWLIKRRMELGLSQDQVAEAIGCDRSSYSYYELGVATPSIDRVLALASVLDLPISYVVTLFAPLERYNSPRGRKKKNASASPLSQGNSALSVARRGRQLTEAQQETNLQAVQAAEAQELQARA